MWSSLLDQHPVYPKADQEAYACKSAWAEKITRSRSVQSAGPSCFCENGPFPLGFCGPSADLALHRLATPLLYGNLERAGQAERLHYGRTVAPSRAASRRCAFTQRKNAGTVWFRFASSSGMPSGDKAQALKTDLQG